MKIPLYKLFLVLAIYGVVLAAFAPSGVMELVLATIISTAASAVVLLVRRDRILPICIVGFCSVCAGLAGILCLSEILLDVVHGYDHGFGERERCAVAAGVICAIVGGVVASILLRKNRND